MRRILFLFVGLLFILAVLNFSLLRYAASMGAGQLHILLHTRDVKDVLADSAVSDSVKQKLKLIEEIKQFGFDSLGLKATNNYSTFFNQQGKPVLWVLTASAKYKLESYEWKFPFLGTVPYKGFFKKDAGIKEEEQLKLKGLDTDLGTTGAWSTLGWFRDPVMSSMLRRSGGELAEMILHELTHATVFVKDSITFNENLASFVGEEGAIKFLATKYGTSSLELKEYEEGLMRQEKLNTHFLNAAEKLRKLYSNFREQDSEKTKDSMKFRFIRSVFSEADSLSLISSSSKLKERLKSLKDSDLPNNTFFLQYHRYDSRKDEFKKEMNEQYEGNLKTYLAHQKEKWKS